MTAKLTDISQVRPIGEQVVFEQLHIAQAEESGLELPESSREPNENICRIIALGCDAEELGFEVGTLALMKKSFYGIATTVPLGMTKQRYVIATYETIGAIIRPDVKVAN